MAATQSVKPEMTPWPEVTGTAAMRAPCSGTQTGGSATVAMATSRRSMPAIARRPVLEHGEFGHEPADVVLGEPRHVRASCKRALASFSGSELEARTVRELAHGAVRRGTRLGGAGRGDDERSTPLTGAGLVVREDLVGAVEPGNETQRRGHCP